LEEVQLPVDVDIEKVAMADAVVDAVEDVVINEESTEAMSAEEKLHERRDSFKTLTTWDHIAMRRMGSYSTKIPTALAIRRRKAGMI
jgi:hypothetical protein